MTRSIDTSQMMMSQSLQPWLSPIFGGLTDVTYARGESFRHKCAFQSGEASSLRNIS